MTSDSRPVSKGVVEAWREGRRIRQSHVNSAGKASFDDLERGTYRVRIVADSIDKRFLPPWDGVDHLVRPGLGATRVDLSAGETEKVAITLLKPAVVNGYVYAADGSPLEGVWVRFGAIEEGLERLYAESKSDSTGFFEVRVYPAEYRSRIIIGDREHAPGVLPPGKNIAAFEDGTYSLEFRFGGGTTTVVGSVVDQDGVPFAGVEVWCTYYEDPAAGLGRFTLGDLAATTVTGADGSYQFDRLYRKKIALNFGVEQLPYANGAAAKVAQPVDRVILDLRLRGDTVIVRPTEAVRNRPCYFSGVVTVSDALLAELGRSMGDVEVTATRGQRPRGARVAVAADGTFVWACETPMKEVTIHARLGSLTDCVRLVPVPDGQVDVVLNLDS